GADDVGTREHIETAPAREVADVHAEGARRALHVDVPVVAAAVDFDVAHNRFGRAGGVLAADVEQPEDRLGPVPSLGEGGLGPLDGQPGQFPVGVQPVRVADHDDNAVLAVAGWEVLGHLGGKVFGWDTDFVFATFDLLLGGVAGRGIAGGGGLRLGFGN